MSTHGSAECPARDVLNATYVAGWMHRDGDRAGCQPAVRSPTHDTASSDGDPGRSKATLLLLLTILDRTDDGRAIWEVLDAIVAHTPDGEPERLQVCDGEDGVAFYPAGNSEGDTIPVAAAWGPNPDVTAFEERDPDEVTCRYMGP